MRAGQETAPMRAGHTFNEGTRGYTTNRNDAPSTETHYWFAMVFTTWVLTMYDESTFRAGQDIASTRVGQDAASIETHTVRTFRACWRE